MAAGGVIAVCAASSNHGATKTKSHAIMQLRRNREGLRRPLNAASVEHQHSAYYTTRMMYHE